MHAHSIIVNAMAGVALLSTSATALAVPEPAKALEARGTSPINVQDACVYLYGNQAYAQTIGNGCNDWVCESNGEELRMYMAQWCGWSLGRLATAQCHGGVYDWVCIWKD
jgi:hypothetical protein